MRFYNREKELQSLKDIQAASHNSSKMTVIVGRRRIGKTRLIAESLSGVPYLYFFVARKDEKLLCEEFTTQIKETLGINIYGEISRFKDIFAFLMDYAERQPLSLVIDEFQEFNRINPSVYSDMQNTWDRKKEHTQMNLVLSGSVFSLMKKIFENSREPLFGRANERLHVKPFSVNTLKKILDENQPNYTSEDLLAFYIFTGGVPKYIESFIDRKKLSYADMLGEIFKENSIFLEEGKNVLIEEFGKEYTTYFSILSLIAGSKTSRSEIESILQKDIGGYLGKLENEYQIIRKVQPMFAKPGGKSIKYEIEDKFLNFWFRFIYKNKGAVEIGNFEYLKAIVQRDFPTFSGHFLEKYFIEKLALSGEWSEIGSYWESGFQNQIDIVALNHLTKKALLVEVKLNEKKYSEALLISKSVNLANQLKGYTLEFRNFSLKDM
ncbi:MAG TPA: ATP-binding protein [Haliscomenobacter sp.]|uniref:ATP-binding protein n=1 Tax=Haliscomenobacter sp. TaxID=2717303 RepID=UPI001E1ABE7E|nr:ATP-binding protein [Haliscomenobacter sp.]MBK9491774.1 AAA family ATPase [Haliscomenobacter sp.]HOY15770.1 ATP-binding protein [Haliscomenobacter sp.]HPH18904.1 ATP-binding protein [Haliscomenobacter sp.]